MRAITPGQVASTDGGGQSSILDSRTHGRLTKLLGSGSLCQSRQPV
jgi:hypothetical protein